MWRNKCSIEITAKPYTGDINQAAFLAGDKPAALSSATTAAASDG